MFGIFQTKIAQKLASYYDVFLWNVAYTDDEFARWRLQNGTNLGWPGFVAAKQAQCDAAKAGPSTDEAAWAMFRKDADAEFLDKPENQPAEHLRVLQADAGARGARPATLTSCNLPAACAARERREPDGCGPHGA